MKTETFVADNISALDNSHLGFAGYDTTELAKKYGTPCYLMDETRIRNNCRMYQNACKSAFGESFRVMYASKAASFKRMYEIMREENMNIDVVSQGEIVTALKAGFPLENAFFHSNNKTDDDISFAMDNGIGFFVCDTLEELCTIDELSKEKGIRQRVLLRLTPGIDPHTYEAVATGKVDSKFGFSIKTGNADEALKKALSLENIELYGFHCHVGSQLFDSDVFFAAARIMLDFIKMAKCDFGYEAKMLDLGGGYGVRYVESDPYISISENIVEVASIIKEYCAEIGIDIPVIGFEPGRSIAADAGMTLYTVGSVKTVNGYNTYVSIDGGMTDNVRYAMYGSAYTVLPCDIEKDCDMKCSVVGRCCESGDIIQRDVMLPSTLKRGDNIAVCTTGAYNYSMASNYNRIPRPPVVMLSENESYLAVRRESYEDLTALDI